jgi:hypothetical protein
VDVKTRLEGADWTLLPQNRVQWQAFPNMVMKIQKNLAFSIEGKNESLLPFQEQLFTMIVPQILFILKVGVSVVLDLLDLRPHRI